MTVGRFKILPPKVQPPFSFVLVLKRPEFVFKFQKQSKLKQTTLSCTILLQVFKSTILRSTMADQDITKMKVIIW